MNFELVDPRHYQLLPVPNPHREDIIENGWDMTHALKHPHRGDRKLIQMDPYFFISEGEPKTSDIYIVGHIDFGMKTIDQMIDTHIQTVLATRN